MTLHKAPVPESIPQAVLRITTFSMLAAPPSQTPDYCQEG